MTSNGLDFMCPICRDYLLEPRIYECGHTICERCMKKSDEMTDSENSSLFQVSVYRCPICRDQTHIKWFKRPINHTLIEIFSKNSDYSESLEKYRQDKLKDLVPETPKIPENVNVANIVNSKRREQCDKLYNEIMPLIFEIY